MVIVLLYGETATGYNMICERMNATRANKVVQYDTAVVLLEHNKKKHRTQHNIGGIFFQITKTNITSCPVKDRYAEAEGYEAAHTAVVHPFLLQIPSPEKKKGNTKYSN